VTGQTYPATPYLRCLTAANGWRAELVRDRHGEPEAIIAVRAGPTWTDSVVIEGEDRCVASRHRTCDDSELPAGPAGWHRDGPGVVLRPPDSAGAVWFRDGRAEDVLAELFELQEGQPQ